MASFGVKMGHLMRYLMFLSLNHILHYVFELIHVYFVRYPAKMFKYILQVSVNCFPQKGYYFDFYIGSLLYSSNTINNGHQPKLDEIMFIKSQYMD